MTRSKVSTVFCIGGIVLFAVFVFVSCAARMDTAKKQRIPPAILAIPNVVTPVGAIDYIGANFNPGEKITVVFLFISGDPEKTGPIENVVTENARGLKVDSLGSFQIIKATAPEREGVYALRVYDENWEVIATSAFRVKAKEAKK